MLDNILFSSSGLSRAVTESLAQACNPLSNPKMRQRLIEASSPAAVLSRAIANGAYVPNTFAMVNGTIEGILRTIDNAQRAQVERMVEITKASHLPPLDFLDLLQTEPAQLAPDEEGEDS